MPLDDFSKLEPPKLGFPKQQRSFAPHLKEGETILQLIQTNAFVPYKISQFLRTLVVEDSHTLHVIIMQGFFAGFYFFFYTMSNQEVSTTSTFWLFIIDLMTIFAYLFTFGLHLTNTLPMLAVYYSPVCYVAVTQKNLHTLRLGTVETYPLDQLQRIELHPAWWTRKQQQHVHLIFGPLAPEEERELMLQAVPKAAKFRDQLLDFSAIHIA